ncbi:TonB-dependent receptor domain-containing protein [Paraglaciecola polaris]|uniref:TonB-dependent receptor n=1 Tax=Paraglaciecola polaris LMG 21857 TaxID=1129793 RepID=K6YKW9_9ALTE|nr:TonB-dependent receptor [Paraglaciecola polaris]GAC33339.1 TonB-dependent receptor [Paraglaciecola polaris LMG 21857]
MFTNSKLTKSIRLAMAVGTVAAISSSNVYAQEAANAAAAEETAAVEKISVTGSRIRKADFVSNAPVASLGSDQFVLTATVNTESLLNTLPQVVPGLDGTSNNPGNGTASIDLRGLGTNRTLVLINGTRVVPTTAGGQVDINAIPTALIENVEVLTGGASAIYGSDAVAGVVNFILKDDFEGVQTSVGYESSEEGDATIWNADLTIGGNFADGKGNVVFNMAYADREAVLQDARGFSTFAQFDDGEGNLFDGGSSLVPATRINSAFPQFDGSPGIFNTDGSIREFISSGDDNDFYNFAPTNYLQLPQERHQITALGHYEISDNAEIYGRAMFTDSRVPQQLAATPILQEAEFTIDGNPFITPETQAILSGVTGNGIDTDGDGIDDTGTAQFRRRMLEVGPRRSEDAFNSYQFQFGMRGAFGDSNWTYDTYYQTGKVNQTTAQLGNVNRDRFSQALLLATDDAGQVILDADGNPSCANTSANGGISGCSPMNLYGEGNISPEAASFVSTAVNSNAVFEQKLFAANISGDSEGFFELPGGPLGIAFGYENRSESFEFLPSQDLAAGTIAGFNGAPGLAGQYKVDEFYVEAFLPILFDLPFAYSLEMELAYRTADYSTAGSVDSYKIAGSWAPIEQLRFRAGFNTAVRAPNIGELFSPQSEGFPPASDPCSASGSAGAQTDAIRAMCVATGVPAANVFTPLINPASGQVRSIGGGNPDLKQEEADTYTIGFVAEPTEDLTFSVDYFNIEIDDAVGAFGGGTNNILAVCYDPTDPRGGVNSIYCNNVNRRSDGSIDFVQTSSQNIASITLKGYDVISSYTTDFQGGAVSVDYLGTFTRESDFLPGPGEPAIECAGNFGSDCGEPLPDYKHRMTFKWTGDDFTAQLVWRYIGETHDDDSGTDYAVEKIDGESYFNTSASYYFNDNYRVTAGIDNLFDKEPPILGDNAQQANTYPATYDVFGRTYYINVTATF